MVRVALFAVAALVACGRIGFDEAAGALDGNTTSGSDGALAGGDATGTDASGTAGTFGTMQVGISTQNAGADRVWISRFALTEPAMVHTLVVHAGPTGAQASTVRGVIYADAAAAPTTLLGTTTELALPGSSTPGWLSLPFAAPIALSPGMYWLGTHNAITFSIEYRSAVGITKFGADLYSDGTDATYGGGATSFTMELSIYAEYTR